MGVGVLLLGQALGCEINQAYHSNVNTLSAHSMEIAVLETKQGKYKEYTVEKVDDSALDEIRSNFKTAEETDTSRNKVRRTI